MKRLFLMLLVLTGMACTHDTTALSAQTSSDMGRTLVVFYSYTNNCRNIVTTLTSQIEADVLEIQPAEKGLKYEANGYALGTQLLNAIKANPNEASSYPAIDPVETSPAEYRNVIIVTPLWWSQMAAPMQTYLFHYGSQMAGKKVALIVSSASSSISGVVSDCNRLVPNAQWAGNALWINNSNRSRTATLLADWLATQEFETNQTISTMYITIDGQTHGITLADNQAAKSLVERLQSGPLALTLSASGGFEIWGPLGFSLPTSNEHFTAQPGDVVLYNGSNICLFYGQNAWSYTRLGHIDGLSESQLRTFLKAGQTGIAVTLSLTPDATAIGDIPGDKTSDDYFTLAGQRTERPRDGIFVTKGRKVVL